MTELLLPAPPDRPPSEAVRPGGPPDAFLAIGMPQRHRRRARRRRLAAITAVVVAVAAAAWVESAPWSEPTLAPDTAASTTTSAATTSTAPLRGAPELVDRDDDPVELNPIADPVRVEVPAIGVDADLIEVGLKADGAMEVPDFGLAGWYGNGPSPGAAGPAVIVAHVDSRQGPDVFHRLRELAPGNEIRVHGADGETFTWTMDSSELVDKDRLPTDRIWNDTEQPVLRLITCGGEFDRSARSYRSNVIVYASHVGR